MLKLHVRVLTKALRQQRPFSVQADQRTEHKNQEKVDHIPIECSSKKVPAEIRRQINNDKKILLANGIKVNFVEVGFGEQPILCFPGTFGTISTDFGLILRNFDYTKFRLIVLDPPGYGKSRPPARDFRGNYLRRDAHVGAELMNKIGYDKYSLLGCSLGGTSALCVAIDFPKNIRHIVTSASMSFNDPLFVEYTKQFENIVNWSKAQRETGIAIYGTDYLSQMSKDAAAAASNIYQEDKYFFSEEELGKISCPVLVIHGTEDNIADVSHAHNLVKFVQKPTLHLVPGGGHFIHLTHTHQFLNTIQTILAKDA